MDVRGLLRRGRRGVGDRRHGGGLLRGVGRDGRLLLRRGLGHDRLGCRDRLLGSGVDDGGLDRSGDDGSRGDGYLGRGGLLGLFGLFGLLSNSLGRGFGGDRRGGRDGRGLRFDRGLGRYRRGGLRLGDRIARDGCGCFGCRRRSDRRRRLRFRDGCRLGHRLCGDHGLRGLGGG
ncbi:hypothetical protein ACR820_08225 [Streptomyces netropsis]